VRYHLTAARLWQLNREVRDADGGVGFMVGAGLHFSYAGLIEEFKAVGRAAGDNKRRTSDRDTAASCLHMAARQFKTIFTGACA
jgi:hypothetical protein